MKILLYSKSNFIADELKKESEISKNLHRITTLDNIKNEIKNSNQTVVLHHIDDFPNDSLTFSELIKSYPQLLVIGLENQPNNLNGCRLLQLGYKSYLHAVSNGSILSSAIESITKGNMYVYPALMQFLVSQIPSSMQENKNLDSLTPKELEVLQLVSKGYSNAKIAKELDIAEVTVKKHIGSMFEKLEVKDRLSLALILK